MQLHSSKNDFKKLRLCWQIGQLSRKHPGFSRGGSSEITVKGGKGYDWLTWKTLMMLDQSSEIAVTSDPFKLSLV